MDKLKPLRDEFTKAEREFGRPLTAQEMAIVSNDFHTRATTSVQEAAKVLLDCIEGDRDKYRGMLKNNNMGGLIGLQVSLRAIAGEGE